MTDEETLRHLDMRDAYEHTLKGKISKLEAHVTYMQAVGTEQVERIRQAERERDQAIQRAKDLTRALGFREECWQAPADGRYDAVLGDAKLLRPEMAKARERVREIECSLGFFFDEEIIKDAAGPGAEMLLKIWRRAKQVERDLETQRTATYQAVEREHLAKRQAENWKGTALGLRAVNMRLRAAVKLALSFFYNPSSYSASDVERAYNAALVVAGHELTWSEVVPTVKGWYWFRWKGEPESVVRVVRVEPVDTCEGLRMTASGDGNFTLFDLSRGEWAGPLDGPIEPAAVTA